MDLLRRVRDARGQFFDLPGSSAFARRVNTGLFVRVRGEGRAVLQVQFYDLPRSIATVCGPLTLEVLDRRTRLAVGGRGDELRGGARGSDLRAKDEKCVARSWPKSL